jgi:GDP-4-dehydro-6-deoxy-D-mannose reductase
MTTETILITGAGGFVGRHLTALLRGEGLRTVGLERPEVAARPAPPGVDLLPWELGTADPGAPAALARLLDDQAVTAVVHLAGQSSAGASFGDPAGTVRANLQGAIELLESLRLLAAGGGTAPRAVLVGSAEEYGAAAGPSPCREDDPVLPISPYGTSKAAATQLCRQYHRAFGLPILAVRAFAHTGPGQDDRFVFPSFAAQLAAIEAGRADPVLRVGDLSPARDYLDVRDVVRAYRDLLRGGEPGDVYNVCSGSALTIRDGLEILLGLSSADVSVEIDSARLRPADIPRLVGDPGRLRAATGWSPRLDFRDTLRDLLEAARRDLT